MRAVRAVRVGRLIQIARPRALTGGPSDRYIPEDIERIWDGSMGTDTPALSHASGVGQVGQAIVILPPEFVPPPQSTQFQPYALTVTNAVQVLPLWQFVVPKSSVLIIKGIDLYATNTTTGTAIVFSLLVNGAPYPGYGIMNLFAGVAAVNARSFNDITLRFTEGQTVQLNVSNGDGGNYQVAGGAQGWYYSRSIADRYALQAGL